MKKVGIIGGGIAGLTCAYKLSQKGIKSIVFEKQLFPGGRLQWSGVIGGRALHPYTYDLIQELELGEVMVPLGLTDIAAILPDGNLIKMEDFPKMIQSFSPEEAAFFQKLSEFFAKESINVKNPSPGMRKLRDISFAEYMVDCPEKLKPMLGLELNFHWVKDWKEISAEYGVVCMAPFFTVIPKEEVYVFEENMIIITNVLAEKIGEAGSEVRTSTEVKKVEKANSGFTIHFEKDGKSKQEKVDKVVFAVPLTVTQEIFPELNLESDIKYVNSKCILVQGNLKPEYNRKALFLFPGHKSNLSMMLTMFPEEHRLFPLDPGKEVDLSSIYKEFRILDEVELIPAWPIIPHKAKVPELKSNIEGVFLCGDFYHFASHDTSVGTAEMVAELISS